MWKYFALLLLVLGIGFFYAFLKDPCNNQVRADFSDKYPGHKILDSGAAEGSRETVRCHISYQKPDSEQVYEDIWLYRYAGSGWKFSRIIETPESEQTP